MFPFLCFIEVILQVNVALSIAPIYQYVAVSIDFFYIFVKQWLKMTLQLIKSCFHSFPLGQNGCHFADNIVSCIFTNEKFCILIKISPKFVELSNWQDPSIGLDDNWTPKRRQGIIWTNTDIIHWRIIAALGEMSYNIWGKNLIIGMLHPVNCAHNIYTTND